MWFVACVTFAAIGILIQGQDGLSLRKDAVLLVKNLFDAADALLNKAGNWGGKDRLSAVLKKIKKDVSKCLDQGSFTPRYDLLNPSSLSI